MLTNDQKNTIESLVNESLNQAEKHWEDGGHQLVTKSVASTERILEIAADHAPSNIPGHSIVRDNETIIDEFIAFVVDMRDSTNHLLCDISHKRAKVTMLQRLFYETSALLPALAKTINFHNGNVTEYLGDGVLALFRVKKDEEKTAIYAAHDAAQNTVGDTRKIVNDILHQRYSLPEIDLGVGLALSKTILTLVGLKGEKHPKAFGECIYRATKLSKSKNSILVDEKLYAAWPQTKGGKIIFKEKTFDGLKGYRIDQ